VTANGERATVLRSFRRALRREAHVLARLPGITSQQLHNRLQWEGEPVRSVAEAGSPPPGPWIRTRRAPRESASLVRTLVGHEDWVFDCAVAPDGSFVVSAGRDRVLKVWDTASGRERRTLAGHRGKVLACAVSPDGRRVASGSEDGTVGIWDVESGARLATLEGHTDWVWGCAYSPDGSQIASVDDDGTVRSWDATTGAPRLVAPGAGVGVDRMEYRQGWGSRCRFSPDGSFIVAGSTTLEARSGTPRPSPWHGWDCSITPDGALLVTTMEDDTLVWDVAAGVQQARLEGHTAKVSGCAVSPDGRSAVTASHDGSLKVWDLASAREIGTLAGHAGRVRACAFAPDGSFVASASHDGTLKIWDPGVGSAAATFEGHVGEVHACAFSADGSLVATAGEDGTCRLWDGSAIAPHTPPRVTITTEAALYACAVAPDGEAIVAGGLDGDARTWSIASGEQIARCDGHANSVSGCALSPDGALLATASADGTLKIWDPGTGAHRATLDHPREGAGPASLEDLARVKGEVAALDCAVSPDGTFLVSVEGDGTARIWDAATGDVRHVLRGHDGPVQGCAVAPDASFVVSAGSDGTVRIWDPSTGRERAVLRGHRDEVRDCAVTPDAALVLSGGDDGALIAWDAKAGTEVCRAVMAGGIMSVAAHPSSLLVATGDRAGNLCLAELVDVVCGPLAVTALDEGTGLEVRCPSCRVPLATRPSALGSAGSCPWCTAPLRTGLRVGLGSSGWVSRPGPQPRPDERQTPLTGLMQAVEAILAEGEPARDRARPPTFDGTPVPEPGGAAIPELPPPTKPWLNAPVKESPVTRMPQAAIVSLSGLLAASGLRYEEEGGGTYNIGFEGSRADALSVRAMALRNELAFLVVQLPKPGLFGGDPVLRRLLEVSFRADYVKALAFEGGELALACEQPLALLTPTRLRGLVRGLATLADVRGRDLGDADGWGRRLLACRLAQGSDLSVDRAGATAALRALAGAGGLAIRERDSGLVVVDLPLAGLGRPLALLIRVSERLVSAVAFLGDVKPKGNKGAYMRRLLELNRAADVARLGLDNDGDVALLYEVPDVDPGLFDRVREQFGSLLAALVALEQGR
jgi:WD40 repeat protein